VVPLEHFARLRGQEMEAAAAAHRLARECRGVRRAGPSRALRLYARLWWASRPRAAAWTPGLLKSSR
jgi:hypothetical protein